MAVILAAAPSVITDPSWRREPTAEEMADQYPLKAIDAWVEGKVVIVCRVATTGKLNNCRVVSEEPQGLGFGNAALGVSGSMEMNPQLVDGVPDDGGEVRIPLQFRLPPLGEDYARLLTQSIQCYGYLGAKLDAHSPIDSLAEAVDAIRGYARYGARVSPEWRDTVDARMAAERARPTADQKVIDDCLAGMEDWRAHRSPPPPLPMR